LIQEVPPQKMVKVPLGGVYVSALLAGQMEDEDTYLQLFDAIKRLSGQYYLVSRWFKTMERDEEKRIISFHRTELDRYMAGAMYPTSSKNYFKLYSDSAIGDLGFYLLSDTDGAVWVDRYASSGYRTSGHLILEPNRLNHLLMLAGLVDATPLRATVSQQDQFLIHFDAPWLAYLGLIKEDVLIGANLIRATSRDSREISQQQVKQTSLGYLRLRATSSTIWSLIAPPERVMQIHAASAHEQFLYLTIYDGLRFLFKLPDFLGDSPEPSRVFLDLENAYSSHIGWDFSKCCLLDKALVKQLMSSHDWVCASDPLGWFELIDDKKKISL